jgi:hypothetical protein
MKEDQFEFDDRHQAIAETNRHSVSPNCISARLTLKDGKFIVTVKYVEEGEFTPAELARYYATGILEKLPVPSNGTDGNQPNPD